MDKALILIDLQNDYFSEGKFPLWNAKKVLDINIELIKNAQSKNIPIFIVQHVAKAAAPFFNEGSEGVKIHAKISELLPSAPIIIKECADAFYKTQLDEELQKRGVKEIILTGMMTQNCVTHTVLSKMADKYQVSVVADACSTVSEMIHLIALNALSIRVKLLCAEDFLKLS